MKSFRCGAMNTQDINSVFLEIQKAMKEQKKRNDDSYTSLYSYMTVLKGYVEQLDSALSRAVYYKTYFEELCVQNGV